MKNKAEAENNWSEETDSILNAIHHDILITDGSGTILRVSGSFEANYGIQDCPVIGKNVCEMEREGFFKPSVTAAVLKTGEEVTMCQKNKNGQDIVVTAVPVRNEDGEIFRVISFSRDVTEFLDLQTHYMELEDKVQKYAGEIEELRTQSMSIDGVVGKSTAVQATLRTIGRIAPFDVNVLLTGESGVGKTMFAKVIHNKSKRAEEPFIEINCGAIPENLLESELFGYEAGSFTGAGKNGKLGLIELAQNGTLFLDEISELSTNLQVKILKVIQDKCITRVGGVAEIRVDFRLIAASNKDFTALIAEGLFREDLFYRLNVITIAIPPLRERKDDIVALTMYFLDKFNENHGLQKKFSHGIFNELLSYGWPGNIRELENIIERIVLTVEQDVITAEYLPGFIRKAKRYIPEFSGEITLCEALEVVECQMVKSAYEKYGTTIGVAAALGISQPTAVRKLNKYVRV